jgi:hypothetical protein
VPGRGGQPTKLTPATQKMLCEAIAAGNYYEAACAYAGISYAAFARWMRLGKKAKKGKYFKFFKTIKKVEADAEVTVVAQWRKQIPTSWQAARDFLARRFPERWAPKEHGQILKLAQAVEQMEKTTRGTRRA